MKTILIEIEDEVAEKLERVAPGRSRRRSEFIRSAIRRALWGLEEQATAEAYRRHPDSAADAYVDASVWESNTARRKRRK
jgi:predicted transcriptional regulator